MAFFHEKLCTGCNNVYSRKEKTEAEFQQLINNDIGDVSVLKGNEIVTTYGCCSGCMDEEESES